MFCKVKDCLWLALLILSYACHADQEGLLKDKTHKLVDKAVVFFNKSSINVACFNFVRKKEWQQRPITLFLIDSDGICFFDQAHAHAPWNHIQVKKDFFDDSLIPRLIAQGNEGGWVTYSVLNSLRQVYVKTVIKNGRTYVLGAGFFDNSPSFIAKLVVQGIKHYWQHMNYEKLFDIVSNDKGPLVVGSIYGIVIDDTGLCWAHGSNPILIAQNLIQKDSNPDWEGFKQAIETAKKEKDGAWIEFQSMGLKKRLYIESHFDQKAKKKFIVMAGYYIPVNKDMLVASASDVAKRMQEKNIDEILLRLSHIETEQPGTVVKDGIHFMVVDKEGVIRVFSYQPQALANVGRNVSDYVDQKGRRMLKTLFDRVFLEKKGWASQFSRNSLERMYGVRVDTAKGPFVVITFGYYPSYDYEIAKILTQDAYDFLSSMKSVIEFDLFTHSDSPFIKGQSSVNVYDKSGYCWVSGMEKHRIWLQDEEFNEIAEGWVDDERLANTQRLFFKRIEKKRIPNLNQDFMISSGFYKASKGSL